MLDLSRPMVLTPIRTRTPHPRDRRTTGFVDAAELLPLFPRLLITGAAGSGKTTWLQTLATSPRCVFFRLATLAAFVDTQPVRWHGDDEQALVEFLDSRGGLGEIDWPQRLRDGGYLLLMDALDEAWGRLRGPLLDVIGAASREWPDCRMVVTSRPMALAEVRALGFRQAAIEPDSANELGQRRVASRAFVHRAVERSAQLSNGVFTAAFVADAARQLALAMTGLASPDGDAWRAVIDRATARQAIEPIAREMLATAGHASGVAPADAWLDHEAHRRELLVEVDGQLSFSETSAQEWLAAEALSDFCLSERSGHATARLLDRLEPHLGDPRHADVLISLLACIRDRDPIALEQLAAAAVERAETSAEPARRARFLALTADLLNVRNRAANESPLASSTRRRFQESAAHLLATSADAVPAADRISLLDGLARAHRDRSGTSTAAPDAAGVDLLPVPDRPWLRIGRCPVTVADYQRFVDDAGYERQALWREGWTVKMAERWERPGEWCELLETPSHPIVNVSWYEATAYSRWLALCTGLEITLPDADEWQAAAHHPAGPYPWGADEPDEERLNFDQRIGRTSPVGAYPRGAAPGGHLDLGGNVWEWCRDADADGAVVRGGGWFSQGRYAASAYQYRFHAANRFHDLGFRVAARLPDPARHGRSTS